jgi:branched-chain amino acid transport system permease protein
MGMNIKTFSLYLLVCGIIFAIAPFFISSYYVYLIALGMVYGIWALSWNVLFNYTGLLSFGHALWFALGAYVVGLTQERLMIMSMECYLGLTLVVSFILSLAVGYLCVRYTQIYFSLLTQGFSMLFYAMLVKFYSFTHGTDGISVRVPALLGMQFTNVESFLRAYYYYILLIFLLCATILWIMMNSPFGKSLQFLRDNSLRARFIGIPVIKYRLWSFVIAGVFGAISGALFAPLNRQVCPELTYWSSNGNVVFMTLLGGFSVFAGSAIGAIIFVFLQNIALTLTIYWQLIAGIVIVVIVYVFPKGLTVSIKDMVVGMYKKVHGR